MAKNGRSLTLSASSNSAESKPEMVLALFFLWLWHEINKKNNRGLEKVRHIIFVKNNQPRKGEKI